MTPLGSKGPHSKSNAYEVSLESYLPATLNYIDNPAQGQSCLDFGYSKSVLNYYHPGYLSTTLVVSAPSYQFHHSLDRGLSYGLFSFFFFFLKISLFQRNETENW